MNIEKLKNYNQKMLAVFLTIAVLAGIGVIIYSVARNISERIAWKRNSTHGIVSSEAISEYINDSIRLQIGSYESPILVDSLNQIYIMKVQAKDLESPESINRATLPSFNRVESRVVSNFYYPLTFNNLIIYDDKNGNSSLICDYKIYGSDLAIEHFGNETVIAFLGSWQDTDNNGLINNEDMDDLFVYSLKHKELKKISLENSTVSEFIFIQNSLDIFITFGYDRDNNKYFDYNSEPSYVMKYDYQKNELIPLVDKELETKIQGIIENI